MAVPKFNNVDLVSDGAREVLGPIEPRVYMETMPGLHGEFVQTYGRRGRDIVVHGFLTATGDTADEAHQALKSDLYDKQMLADGQTVATYLSTDGATSYAYCVLLAYNQAGNMVTTKRGSQYQCRMPVVVRLRQLYAG